MAKVVVMDHPLIQHKIGIMTYFIENYGCEMNIAESASVEQILIKRGWTKAEDVQLADFVVINTCSVRGSAEERIFGRLGFFTGLKKVRVLAKDAKRRTIDFPRLLCKT